MRPFTTGRLRWKEGISFADLSKGVVDFFQRTELRFDRGHGRPDLYDAVFRVRRGGSGFEHLDRPWEDDPMLRPQFWAAYWSLLEPDGGDWASFSYHWENQPGATQENLPIRVLELGFGFDGVLYYFFDQRAVGYYSGYQGDSSFSRALGKYHLLKDLFRALNCDELVGVDGNAASALTQRYDSSPRPYGEWCFRFARGGTQVLIRSLEERRMPLPNTDPEFVYSRADATQTP